MKKFFIIIVMLLAAACQKEPPPKYKLLPRSRYEEVRPPANLPDHSNIESNNIRTKQQKRHKRY